MLPLSLTNPELIDTHAHLYAPEFDQDRMEVWQNAKKQGISHVFLPNVDQHSIGPMLQLADQDPDHLHPMMGLHPCSVKEDYKTVLELVRQWLDKRQFCAIGEIGIDLYWDKSTLAAQEDAFLTQVEWATALDLPIVIHSRESTALIIQHLRPLVSEKLRGIFHCFSGNLDEAMEIIDMGFLLGIGGVLTFKKAGLDKVVEQIPLQHLVLETDAPYLAPVPHRGKRNESGYTRMVAEKLAEILQTDIQEVAAVTTANAKRLFGIDHKHTF